MSWNMVSALAELIGSATVVVSLVFVGKEVRHGNALERAEAYRAINLKASAMFADVWARLKGAYADDFAREVEERFGAHGHLPPAPPPQPARTQG